MFALGEEDPAEVYAALSQPIDVDCLLPTGVLIPLRCRPDNTLETIKARLWREAEVKSQYPLFHQLKESSKYVFVGINKNAETEELVEEKKRFCDCELFHPLLKVVERIGDQEEKLLNAEIGTLIGKRLHEFDELGLEVQDFRYEIQQHCVGVVESRNQTAESLLRWSYPPDLELTPDVPPSLKKKLHNGEQILLDLKNPKGQVASMTVKISWTAMQFLKSIIPADENPGDCVLKVCGHVEYFTESNVPLSQYRYIRNCLAKSQRPMLITVRKSGLLSGIQIDKFRMDNKLRQTYASSTISQRPDQVISLWSVASKVTIRLLKATNLNSDSILVRAGIYHGAEPLSDIRTSKIVTNNGGECAVNDVLMFDVDVRDLARNCRLCFVICGTSGSDGAGKKGKSGIFSKKKEQIPLAWVNLNAFDYNGKLRSSTHALQCWSVDGALEDTLNFMGTTVENPDSTCPVLHIELSPFSLPVHYPSLEEMSSTVHSPSPPSPGFQPAGKEHLMKIVEMDPLAELEDQDMEALWRSREFLATIPQSLPKLLKSVKWNNRECVARMLVLLQSWTALPPEQALELLDYQYADQNVRNFAVQSLHSFTDNELMHFLLQLVQVLKYESYLNCDLGKFLLSRALKNQKIGHFLFWHLRAEMHQAPVAVRFGLLLEAYCRGSMGHMQSLLCQQEALSKLRSVTELLQSKTLKERPKGMRAMQETLETPQYQEALSNLVSPLSPSYRLHSLKLDKCKFMDSKMKPLWLVYKNADEDGADVYQIFKNGDDLRQDMLTLQIIGIMDSMWRAQGLDMRMIPYGCLSTGDQVGLIEVVLQANTVAKIQKAKGGGSRGAFDKSTLYKWLQEKNADKVQLDEAIDTFTYSCAGYCVATYVLGIGDRHSDNIMLKETGQLFHIDFGHFLGNFKSKFGVRRERVPFVLTDDFVYVITRGKDDQKEVDKFRRLCEEAFLLLRRKGSLLINLFAMMLSTGIPELRSLDDINYVRDALVLGSSDEEALASFRKKFNEAIKNSWSVSWNWYIHNVVRN
ncbi:phosphatidylinositol 4,5-bisphosphate 3-kinase catalytic subunit alpha isoform-like [Sycon ciliatum]|uniref:phosphatidylinositol 4,5-bisphosphate 3-kinase catalytic subunit alpha isoform-like n=1 Tax=Sycon ciliatum TaxID=27933 RepID=UPI0020AB8B5C|eukprot:scpid44900/ scgid29639/ Phosphatidylinositol 4,5-bisphosphate 3-kinase catalytic subunit alpha isoform; Phosphatidylinositol 4,5-bisphosphate 3-kinase 110 kDa catalytic subunit alpha; Phosphoinositide-3-kinase catalytic alpha polypeptide; Serine/threonine protein kinase PIK3CA